MLVGFYKYLLFPLGLAGGCVPEAYGQTPQDSLYHIREVVVTGRVVRREVIPVQELSGERLQRLNSHNVADARTVDLGRFSLDNMESVTLYNGQK